MTYGAFLAVAEAGSYDIDLPGRRFGVGCEICERPPCLGCAFPPSGRALAADPGPSRFASHSVGRRPRPIGTGAGPSSGASRRMSASPIRRALLILTILGLMMPRISGVVAAAVPGITTIVICTGQGLETIRIDARGDPVVVSDGPDYCVLAHATSVVARTDLPALHPPVLVRTARIGGALVRAHGTTAARPPPRAPPIP